MAVRLGADTVCLHSAPCADRESDYGPSCPRVLARTMKKFFGQCPLDARDWEDLVDFLRKRGPWEASRNQGPLSTTREVSV